MNLLMICMAAGSLLAIDLAESGTADAAATFQLEEHSPRETLVGTVADQAAGLACLGRLGEQCGDARLVGGGDAREFDLLLQRHPPGAGEHRQRLRFTFKEWLGERCAPR